MLVNIYSLVIMQIKYNLYRWFCNYNMYVFLKNVVFHKIAYRVYEENRIEVDHSKPIDFCKEEL